MKRILVIALTLVALVMVAGNCFADNKVYTGVSQNSHTVRGWNNELYTTYYQERYIGLSYDLHLVNQLWLNLNPVYSNHSFQRELDISNVTDYNCFEYNVNITLEYYLPDSWSDILHR
jgi:hypothetical protein